MNFFEHQDQARKSTRWLVVFFLLAVGSLVILVDLLVVVLFTFSSEEQPMGLANIPPSVHAMIAAGVVSVVALACFYKMAQLRGGGRKVAEALGGRLLATSTADLDEKRLLNVVEEMAIASGTSVPPVYVLEDSAINAFAAGYTPHDAVIGVTRGTIDLLNREEMQGVIAHEFSHILNGDMRLNLRLIGILFGIIFIALAGQKIMRASAYSRDGARGVALGLGLVIVGYSGAFFGSLIRAAVSRQREYLADASAVQFTRNPHSIGGALKKIGGWAVGSQLAIPNAAEYGHFYIAEGLSNFAAGFFKTHPPLQDRIRRVDPHWDGQYPKVQRSREVIQEAAKKQRAQSRVLEEPAATITAAAVAAAIANTSAPTADHVDYAQSLISSVPEQLLTAAHETLSAYALVLALVLDKNTSDWRQQLQGAGKEMGEEVQAKIQHLLPYVANLDIKYRLPLIEMAMPALKRMEAQQRNLLLNDVLTVVKADGRVQLWEWALFRVLKLSLRDPEISRAKYDRLKPIAAECQMVLAAVIYSGNCDKEISSAAFAAAASELGLAIDLPDKIKLTGTALSAALKELKCLKPLAKPRFLKALVLAAQHDGVTEAEEIELIRAIADSIDCPMPPILRQ